jgi:hypothetical protein
MDEQHRYWSYPWPPGTMLLSGQDPQKNATDIGGWGNELRDTDIEHRLGLKVYTLQGIAINRTNFMTAHLESPTGNWLVRVR